ncbi:MAG: hypothetical protein AAB229_08680 [Candidatus Hydrogenedentota bacterium]
MKGCNIWIKAAAVAAVGLAMLGTAYAEEESGGRRGNRRNNASTEDNAEMREKFQDKLFEKMAKKLELDDATKTKMKELFERQQKDRQSLNEETRNAVKKLKELVDAKANETELSAQIDKIESLKQKQRDMESKALTEMRAILGTTKTAQLLVLQSQMMNQMRSHMREGMTGNRRGVFRGGSGEGERTPNTGNWGYN